METIREEIYGSGYAPFCSRCLKRLRTYKLDESQTVALCPCCDKSPENWMSKAQERIDWTSTCSGSILNYV